MDCFCNGDILWAVMLWMTGALGYRFPGASYLVAGALGADGIRVWFRGDALGPEEFIAIAFALVCARYRSVSLFWLSIASVCLPFMIEHRCPAV